MSDLCREAFEKLAEKERWKLDSPTTYQIWRGYQAAWNARSLSEMSVPTVEELEDAWLSAGDGDVYSGLKAIHTFLTTQPPKDKP